MRSVLQYLLSGIIGFFVAYAALKLSDLRFSAEGAAIGFLAIATVFILLSIFWIQRIKSLGGQTFSMKEEDLVEAKKYKMFVDYSLCAHASFILSILAFSLSLIATRSYALTMASGCAAIATTGLIYYIGFLMRQVYPERNLPKPTDPDYAKAVFDMADDGEKHVMLGGLRKSQNASNISLIMAIILATFYSLNHDHPQTFSIILMAAVMLVINGSYLFSIRNK